MSISMYSDSSSVSTLFSSLSSSSTGLESILSDYSSLKSGSYYKLAKAYYSDLESSSSSSSSSSTSSSSDSDYNYYDYKTSKTASGDYTYYDYASGEYVKSSSGTASSTAASSSSSTSASAVSSTASAENKAVITAANDLMDTTAGLLSTGSSSVFRKTNITDAETGTTSYGYDKSAIYSSVSRFVDDYNSLLDASAKSSNSSVSNYTTSLKAATSSESSLLSKLGISADSSGKLSIDKDTFESADMATAKSLFNGSGSYAYQVSSKASMINYYATNDSSSSGTTYTSSGSLSTSSYSAGDLLSAIV